jgi:monoamine oxidase
MINRRGLLSGAASLAALVACGKTTTTSPGTRVIVVGAGIAGLAAAHSLAGRGAEVVVLEARDRIGGRIWTSDHWADAPVDLGASWIHGAKDNPITTLADKAGARTVATSYESSTDYRFDGRPFDDATTEAFDRLHDDIADALRTFQDDDGADRSMRAVVERSLRWPTLSGGDRDLVAHLLNDYEHEYAGSTSELSAHYFDSDAELIGDDMVFPAGYRAIPEFLASGLTVRTGQAVTRIEWNKTAVTVHTDRERFQGDHVVVTLPLGVLQSGAVQFDPPLPTKKRTAIDALGMGLLDKCYLRFPESFWPDTDWLTYVPGPDRYGQWEQWLNVARAGGKPILLGLNAADFGRALEKLSDAEIVSGAMQTLRTLFGRGVPDPVDHQITRWAADPYALGAYSFNKTGSTPAMRDHLAASVDGRLHFAGEATSRDSFATVHGAYQSGIRAAQQITD